MTPSRKLVCLALVFFMASALTVPAVRAAEAPDGKVPITTASAEARSAYLAGRDLAERLRVQEARPFFEKAVQADPGFALGWLGLANTQPNAKAFFEALDKAVALAGKASDGEQLMIRGADAGGKGDVATQVKLYEKLTSKYPQDERALVLLANAHFGAQRYADAIALYERAAKIAPKFSQIYNQLGYSYRFLGEMQNAEKAFQKYTEVLPDDPNPWDSYAELLLKLGRFDESIAQYRKALAVRSDFVNSRYGIATCLDLQGKGAEARKELDTALEQAADDGQRRAALLAKAISYVYEGKFEAAQKTLEERLALAEKIHDALGVAGDLVAMGDIALTAGKVESAEKRYQKALQTVESSAGVADANKENQRRFAIYNRAKVALAKGDLAAAEQASEALTKAVEGIGNPFQQRLAHEVAGRVALAGKQWEKAATELAAANQLNPFVRYRLSQALSGKGEEARAKELAKGAIHDNTLLNLQLALLRQEAKAG